MIKSFPLLYYIDRSHEPEMTLKATGYQWYWGYEYPDQGGINFQSYMIPDKEIDKSKGQLRLLSTDNPVVLPVDTNIQILTTAADVIHAFAMPALGVKIDAIPGRINETWVRITKPGIYYGQCSELCGKDHAFMPIEIHAVSREEFNAWAISKGGTGLKVAEAAQSETAPETKPETTPAQKAE
jgi:cytochrome c oxidase subunit 2